MSDIPPPAPAPVLDAGQQAALELDLAGEWLRAIRRHPATGAAAGRYHGRYLLRECVQVVRAAYRVGTPIDGPRDRYTLRHAMPSAYMLLLIVLAEHDAPTEVLDRAAAIAR